MKHSGRSGATDGGGGQCRIGLPLPMPRFRGGRVSQHNDGDPPGTVAENLEHVRRFQKAQYAQKHPEQRTDIPKPAAVRKPESPATDVKLGVGGSKAQRTTTGAAWQEVK